MQDGMKGNPEESLRRALAEFAVETGSGAASERVRQSLRREVRGRAHRRWALTALAAAAAIATIVLGVTARLTFPKPVPPPQTAAAERGPAGRGNGSTPSPELAVEATPPTGLESGPGMTGPGGTPVTAAVRIPAAAGPHRERRDVESTGGWRKGEMVLSPWYYNTALPPTARSVLVRSEVGARTAMRFGVVPAGETAPVEILFGEDGLPRAMRFVQRFPTQKN